MQIVDWRDAPVSQIYYRYDEGDDYEEEMPSGPLRGEVLARRNVTIARSALRRVGCPQGTLRLARWTVPGTPSKAKASRSSRAGRARLRDRRDRSLLARGNGRRAGDRARHAQPRQSAPRDRGARRPRAVRSHHRAGRGPRRHPGRRRLGQDHGRTASNRLPRLPGARARAPVVVPVRGAITRARALRRGRAAVAGRERRAGHHVPRVGAHDPQTHRARRAGSLRRRHACRASRG